MIRRLRRYFWLRRWAGCFCPCHIPDAVASYLKGTFLSPKVPCCKCWKKVHNGQVLRGHKLRPVAWLAGGRLPLSELPEFFGDRSQYH